MSLLLLHDRLKNKLERLNREAVFRKKIGCHHKDFSLVGIVYLINTNIKLGHHVTIYPGVQFFGDGPIVIGDNVDIGNNTVIYSSKSGGIYIGNNTLIAAQCYIIDQNHGTRKDELIRKQNNTVAPVHIGEDVWLAAGVKVLKGCSIGNGAIVGANAVVNCNLEENSISVGVPCKTIKYRE